MNVFGDASSPDAGALDLRALSKILDGPAPPRLAFIGTAGSDEAVSVATEVATCASRDTGRAVLVVHVTPRLGDDWLLFAGGEADGERRFVRALTASERASSSRLLSGLRGWRSGDGRATDYALLSVGSVDTREAGSSQVEVERLLALAAEVFDVVVFAGEASTPDAWSRADSAVIVIELERTAEVLGIRDTLLASGVTVVGVVMGRAPRVVLLRFLPPSGRRAARPGLSAAAVLGLALALGASALWWRPAPDPFPGSRDIVAGDPSDGPRLLARPFSAPVAVPVLATNRLPALGRVESRLVRPASPSVARRQRNARPREDQLGIVSTELTARDGIEPFLSSAATVARVPPPPERLASVGLDGLTGPQRVGERPAPRFTTMAGLDPVSATVVLTAVVRSDGTVGDVRVVEVTGSPSEVVEPAIQAVKQWRYRPATRHGRPVEAPITVHVRFEES